MRRATAAIALLLGATGVLTGCAAAETLSDRDSAALTTLAAVAGPTSAGVDMSGYESTECWLPSDHMIDEESVGSDTKWRVLCRVHYHEPDGTERYQDTTCVGDFSADPMLDHCYRWVYYDLMPRFEDNPAVPAD